MRKIKSEGTRIKRYNINCDIKIMNTLREREREMQHGDNNLQTPLQRAKMSLFSVPFRKLISKEKPRATYGSG